MSDGTIIAVRALPRLATPKLPLAPATKIEWVCSGYAMDFGIDTTPQSGAGGVDPSQDRAIPAPAWSEGVVFAAVNTTNGGRVLAIDPHNGLSALTPGPNGYGGDPF